MLYLTNFLWNSLNLLIVMYCKLRIVWILLKECPLNPSYRLCAILCQRQANALPASFTRFAYGAKAKQTH
jgi:hypothetical protein